jgi:hypothetical protein
MALFAISLLKQAKRPATWVILLILLALIVTFFLALAASAGQTENVGEEFQVRVFLSFPNAYIFLVGIILGFGGLLAVTYGAAVIGADWAGGTVRAIVARGESRLRYPLVTFAAVAIILGIGTAIAMGVGVVTAIVAAAIAGISTDGATDPDTLTTLPDLWARTWLGVTEQAAIGFAIAMLFRSQLAGIAAGLAIYFGQIFLSLVPILDEILLYAPFNVAGAVVATPEAFGDGGFGGATSIDSDLAVVLTVAYLGGALAIASISMWRAQITQ